MIQLDIAGQSYANESPSNQSYYHVAEICRSFQIHSTSLNADNNSRIFGPPHGQLLIIAEAYCGEKNVPLTVNLLTRQLLREDSWFYSLTEESWSQLQKDLMSVLARIPLPTMSSQTTSVMSKKLQEDVPMSLTAAFLAWPHVAIVQLGVSAAYLCRDGGALPLTSCEIAINTHKSTSKGEWILPIQPPSSDHTESPYCLPISGWHGELDSDDVLVLCSSKIIESLSASEISRSVNRANLDAITSAKDLVLTAGRQTEGAELSAIVVKEKSSSSSAEQMEALVVDPIQH